MRVVLDANVFVSGAISRGFHMAIVLKPHRPDDPVGFAKPDEFGCRGHLAR